MTQKHPNSLKNLKPIKDSEKAREMQLKSAASRKAKNALAKQINRSIKDWRTMADKLDVSDAPTALEFLKFRMHQLIHEGKMAEATQIASELVEFEAPKLSRVDQTNKNYDMADLSDEELEEAMAELNVVGLRESEGSQ